MEINEVSHCLPRIVCAKNYFHAKAREEAKAQRREKKAIRVLYFSLLPLCERLVFHAKAQRREGAKGEQKTFSALFLCFTLAQWCKKKDKNYRS